MVPRVVLDHSRCLVQGRVGRQVGGLGGGWRVWSRCRSTVAVGLALLAVGSCADGPGSSQVTVGDDVGNLDFGGEPVGEVIAGADGAWFISQASDRSSDIHVWRRSVGANDPGLSAEVPGLQGADVVAVPGGLEIAGWRCAGDDRSDCSRSLASLVRLDDTGKPLGDVLLIEKDEPLAPSDSVAVVGATSAMTWIAVHGSVVGVDRAGDVTETLPSSFGEHCVVNDTLYGLVDPSVSQAPVDEPVIIGDEESTSAPTTFRVLSYSADRWQRAEEGADIELPGGHLFTGRCAGDRFEISTFDGLLAAVWTEDGWSSLQPGPRPDDLQPVAVSADDRFVLLSDGAVSERTSDGTYEATSLTLPVSRPENAVEGAPVVLEADASGSVVAGCVSWLDDDNSFIPTCDLAAR